MTANGGVTSLVLWAAAGRGRRARFLGRGRGGRVGAAWGPRASPGACPEASLAALASKTLRCAEGRSEPRLGLAAPLARESAAAGAAALGKG